MPPALSGRLRVFQRAIESHEFVLSPEPVVFGRPAHSPARFPIGIRQTSDGFLVNLVNRFGGNCYRCTRLSRVRCARASGPADRSYSRQRVGLVSAFRSHIRILTRPAITFQLKSQQSFGSSRSEIFSYYRQLVGWQSPVTPLFTKRNVQIQF